MLRPPARDLGLSQNTWRSNYRDLSTTQSVFCVYPAIQSWTDLIADYELSMDQTFAISRTGPAGCRVCSQTNFDNRIAGRELGSLGRQTDDDGLVAPSMCDRRTAEKNATQNRARLSAQTPLHSRAAKPRSTT